MSSRPAWATQQDSSSPKQRDWRRALAVEHLPNLRKAVGSRPRTDDDDDDDDTVIITTLLLDATIPFLSEPPRKNENTHPLYIESSPSCEPAGVWAGKPEENPLLFLP